LAVKHHPLAIERWLNETPKEAPFYATAEVVTGQMQLSTTTAHATLVTEHDNTFNK
jgi:hypothetical protein